MKTDISSQEIREFAKKGFLRETQETLDLGHKLFPDLFPNGPIHLGTVERGPEKDPKGTAKRFVAAAAKKRQAASQSEILTVSEAAKILKVTDAGVRYHVQQGNLKPARKNPQRFKVEDIQELKKHIGV